MKHKIPEMHSKFQSIPLLSYFLKKQTIASPNIKNTPCRQIFITLVNRLRLDIINMIWEVTTRNVNTQTFGPRGNYFHDISSKPIEIEENKQSDEFQ